LFVSTVELIGEFAIQDKKRRVKTRIRAAKRGVGCVALPEPGAYGRTAGSTEDAPGFPFFSLLQQA
jgi:hypothetical protein